MSVFDLFRGFFGLSGRHYRGSRDPFFDTMTHCEEEDEDDEDDGVYYDGIRGGGQDPWSFGFTFGSDGVRMTEAPMFGQMLREMEEIFSQLGRWEGQSGHFGVPYIAPPTPPEERARQGEDWSSRNSLRDFMLKTPDSDTAGPSRFPRRDPQESPGSLFKGWAPNFKFNDAWSDAPHGSPYKEPKEDRDLDSAVKSNGLDEILSDSVVESPSKAKSRVFFKSVTVTKVVKPDGTVEERRTVTDSEGNKKTEVIHSGGPGVLEAPTAPPAPPDSLPSSSDMSDSDSLFFNFFKGFK